LIRGFYFCHVALPSVYKLHLFRAIDTWVLLVP
jgi:hypothetical protein